jgi:ketosteroid isomerase-like protein
MPSCKLLFGVLLLSSSSGCVPEAPLHEPNSGPEAMLEIQEAADLFEAAFLEGNPEAVVGLMTEDAVASLIGGPDIVGEEALLRFFQDFFGELTVSAYRSTVVEVEVYGDVSYDRGTFIWESFLSDGTPINAPGRYSAVRHRGSDGVWRLHRLIENEPPS